MIGTVQQREAELAALYPIWENHTQWTWFLKNCQRFSEQVFLIDGNQEITYGEMMNLVIQASGGLYACGVRPGMMAAVDMTNRKELIASVFALSRLVLHCVNSSEYAPAVYVICKPHETRRSTTTPSFRGIHI